MSIRRISIDRNLPLAAPHGSFAESGRAKRATGQPATDRAARNRDIRPAAADPAGSADRQAPRSIGTSLDRRFSPGRLAWRGVCRWSSGASAGVRRGLAEPRRRAADSRLVLGERRNGASASAACGRQQKLGAVAASTHCRRRASMVLAGTSCALRDSKNCPADQRGGSRQSEIQARGIVTPRGLDAGAFARPCSPCIAPPCGKAVGRLDRPIVLVGLMGAGKSTVGRRLAKRLGLPFVDSDSASRTPPATAPPKCSNASANMIFATASGGWSRG